MKATIHVFDFDGVLAWPYTHPELLVPGAERLLRALSEREGHRVMVASFNPRAYFALRSLYEDEAVILEMRAGSNHSEWWRPEQGNGIYIDEVHRVNLSKADMIVRMLDVRHLSSGSNEVHFYDDDEENIREVQRRLPRVVCHHVLDSAKGLLPHYSEWFPGVLADI